MSTSTPKRVTRSMSAQPTSADDEVVARPTAPGPPVRGSAGTGSVPGAAPSNPFNVDLVVPFSIALPRSTTDRRAAESEIKAGYEALLRALEGEGGLRVASRPGRASKGNEEVWLFIGATDEKVDELLEREKDLDAAHGLPPRGDAGPPSPATRLRLLYDLLTAPGIQDGLGITPGKGQWQRVESIAALHEDENDREWIERWTMGGDWRVGLLTGLGDDGRGLGDHQAPPVHLYFHFLTTYTLSLLPLSIISALFYVLTPADSYPPLYALVLAVYSTVFIAVWKIKERKLAVRWGTYGCESVAVSRLRPEYVANNHLAPSGVSSAGTSVVDAIRAGDDRKRDAKVALSVPIIMACGSALGAVLFGIFLLEAFVSQLYEGAGKQVVPLIPTALFSLIVPQVVAIFNKMSGRLVTWEDHPTPVGSEKSLTGKTFAMNAIVAYLGLFLTAYVYVPFGPQIMDYVQVRMGAYSQVAATPEKAGLGPRTDSKHQHEIKSGRLKGQLFAYTVTNQVVNTFLETGLPFIMRFVNDWRAGKTTVKEALHKRGHYGEEAKPATTPEEVEKRFLDKVERELGLPDYSTFTDYAEMVTQFGYVTVWSIVWPLAPVFAFLNNYFEIRTDALKICKHVRRPIGDRVETFGTWIHTLSIISWLGAVTSASLIYLFGPLDLTHRHADLHITDAPATVGTNHVSHVLSTTSPFLQSILPTLVPLVAIALTASHGHIVLRWAVEGIAERVLWRGSDEEREVHRLREGKGVTKKEKRAYGSGEKAYSGGFWNGGEEGAREIGRIVKAE